MYALNYMGPCSYCKSINPSSSCTRTIKGVDDFFKHIRKLELEQQRYLIYIKLGQIYLFLIHQLMK